MSICERRPGTCLNMKKGKGIAYGFNRKMQKYFIEIGESGVLLSHGEMSDFILHLCEVMQAETERKRLAETFISGIAEA